MIKPIQKPRGYLKFSDSRVNLVQLETFARELAEDPRFLSVYIRKVSKDQHGIGFIVDVDTSSEESFDAFSEEIKDRAMRAFGTGLVGWDMASSYYIIK